MAWRVGRGQEQGCSLLVSAAFTVVLICHTAGRPLVQRTRTVQDVTSVCGLEQGLWHSKPSSPWYKRSQPLSP